MKKELLKLLKEEDGYVSGAELGEKLGVSRAAVWKDVCKLKQSGYIIDAVTKKGYRLIGSKDLINEEEIKYNLDTKKIGKDIFFFEELGSTNDVCRKIAEEGGNDGTVVIAEIQNSGKGRLGRLWTSPNGSGIWLSLLLKPNIMPSEASKLTLIAGLSVCKAINAANMELNAMIKWPNDIIINGKKVCGILTEMSAEMDMVKYIVLGIGINVNVDEFPEELSQIATSMKIESGREFERKHIVQNVLTEFEKDYIKYISNNSFKDFQDEYSEMCMTIGSDINVISKEPFSGRAIGINEGGELIVIKETGEEVVVFSGEVSVRNTSKE